MLGIDTISDFPGYEKVVICLAFLALCYESRQIYLPSSFSTRSFVPIKLKTFKINALVISDT